MVGKRNKGEGGTDRLVMLRCVPVTLGPAVAKPAMRIHSRRLVGPSLLLLLLLVLLIHGILLTGNSTSVVVVVVVVGGRCTGGRGHRQVSGCLDVLVL
jgi:hypothetical protein